MRLRKRWRKLRTGRAYKPKMAGYPPGKENKSKKNGPHTWARGVYNTSKQTRLSSLDSFFLDNL